MDKRGSVVDFISSNILKPGVQGKNYVSSFDDINKALGGGRMPVTRSQSSPEITIPSSLTQNPYNFLFKIIRFLQARGLSNEKLFMDKEVDVEEVERVKKIIQKDGEAVQLSNVTKDSNAIGEILKEYLNAREPLTSFELYDNFILIASTILHEDVRIDYFQRLVDKLPRFQYEALKQFIEFCCLLLQNSAINKFTPSTLAGALGNYVLRPREIVYYAPDDSAYTKIVLETMINNFKTTFTRAPVQEQPSPANTRPQTPF